jgi:hypothetical protein
MNYSYLQREDRSAYQLYGDFCSYCCVDSKRRVVKSDELCRLQNEAVVALIGSTEENHGKRL